MTQYTVKGFVQYKRAVAPSGGHRNFENLHKLTCMTKIFMCLGHKSFHDYSSTINIYFTLQCIIVQGIFCWKKMYKADLKYSNFHSNY